MENLLLDRMFDLPSLEGVERRVISQVVVDLLPLYIMRTVRARPVRVRGWTGNRAASERWPGQEAMHSELRTQRGGGLQ
jgi:hypothetical protein